MPNGGHLGAPVRCEPPIASAPVFVRSPPTELRAAGAHRAEGGPGRPGGRRLVTRRRVGRFVRVSPWRRRPGGGGAQLSACRPSRAASGQIIPSRLGRSAPDLPSSSRALRRAKPGRRTRRWNLKLRSAPNRKHRQIVATKSPAAAPNDEGRQESRRRPDVAVSLAALHRPDCTA
jgi:hypothetical protein